MTTTLPLMFQQSVASFGDRPALLFKENGVYHTYTYREFKQHADQLAAYWLESGLGVGERVALLSENRPEWVIADQALLAVGAVTVPIYPSQTPDQIAYLLNDAGASAIVVSSHAQLEKILKIMDSVPSLRQIVVMQPEHHTQDARVRTYCEATQIGEANVTRLAKVARERLDVLRPDDLASIVYTSGTTGEPKGAMLTHANLLTNALAAASAIGIDSTDLELSFLPLSHVFERMVYYGAVSVGMGIAFAESIDTLMQNMAEVRPTFIVCVPRVLEKIHARIAEKMEQEIPLKRELFYAALDIGEFFHKVMQEEGRVAFPTNVLYQAADKLVFKTLRESFGGRLRFIVSGSASLAPEIGRFFQVAGLPVIEGYGLTETAPVLTMNPPERPKFGTVGKALADVEIKLAADGEILAKGPNIMQGYWNKDAETRDVIDEAGWFHTGDIGRFDDEGYLSIIDRKKELLVLSNGKKVAPQPIENRLQLHPIVAQAMLVGEGRNFVAAFIVPDLEVAERMAKAAGCEWQETAELPELEPVREAIAKAVQDENRRLASFEQIKQWHVLPRPFSLETGELTPTFKLRRQVIRDRYQAELDALYQKTGDRVLVKA